MKLLIKILLVIAVVISISFQCHEYEWNANYYILNKTNEEIQVKTNDSDNLPDQIAPNNQRDMGDVSFWREGEINFGVIVRVIPKLRLYDKDGKFIKEWFPEDRNKPGKQFYNESYWALEVNDKNYSNIWIFEITEDDLK